jgi:hypothetical protein
MKIIKLTLFLATMSFATIFSQSMLPPPDKGLGNPQNELNLSDSQKEKIEKIVADKNEKLDKIRTEMMKVMKNLKDSTEYVSKETDKEILKLLTKEQAEKFKTETERHNQFAMMPPPNMNGNGFPQNAPGPNQNVPGQNQGAPNQNQPAQFAQGPQPQNPQARGCAGQDQHGPDCMNNQENAFQPDGRGPNPPDEGDIDSLQDLDIFDLMNILE